MENKINIAEILRDCPKGIKLYSLLYGKCEFERISNNNEFPVVIHSEIKPSSVSFTKYGHYLYEVEDADCVLFPSSKMRSWDKFFKRGDVVFNESSGLVAVFDGWVNDDYVEFNTTINLIKKGDFWGEEEVCDTECFTRVTDEERAEFIAAAEKHYGGKYNPETLQVEPVKVVEPKCSFKPFDKVLVRCGNGIWGATFFSRCDNKSAWAYVGVDCNNWEQCIPYEGNEHLLGTDKSPE